MVISVASPTDLDKVFFVFSFFSPKYRVSVYLCSFILALVEEGKDCWGYLSISVGIWTWICPGILTLKPRLYPILAIWLASDCAWERKIGTELWHILEWWSGRRARACLVKIELKWLFKLYFFDISSHCFIAESKDCNANTGAIALVVPTFVCLFFKHGV